MKKYLVFILAPLMFLFSCVTTVHYIGDNFPPTNTVDIYFSSHDVKKDYQVIGKVSDSGNNLQKVQNQILQEAKKRGANGIIYLNMQNSNVVTNGNSSPSQVLLNADFIFYK